MGINTVLKFAQPDPETIKDLRSVSYSQYNIWSQCPYRWKLLYIDGRKTFTDTIFTLFGTTMHEVIQVYLNKMYTDSVIAANELPLFDMWKYRLSENYRNLVEKNGGTQFCDKQEFISFYRDGITIIEHLLSYRADYFSTKQHRLIGIEVPVLHVIEGRQLVWKGYLDLVLEDRVSGKIKIIDLKTSTYGWNKYQKADFGKIIQLMFYKKFFAAQYGYLQKDVDVEFLIFKRKLYEGKFTQKHIQRFTPAAGTVTMKKVDVQLEDFLNECFTETGEYDVTRQYEARPSKKACKYCEFADNPDLCKKKRNSTNRTVGDQNKIG